MSIIFIVIHLGFSLVCLERILIRLGWLSSVQESASICLPSTGSMHHQYYVYVFPSLLPPFFPSSLLSFLLTLFHCLIVSYIYIIITFSHFLSPFSSLVLGVKPRSPACEETTVSTELLHQPPGSIFKIFNFKVMSS